MVFAIAWLSLLHYSAAVTSLYTFTLKRAVNIHDHHLRHRIPGRTADWPWVEGEDGSFGRACSLPDGAEAERIVTGCERNESGKDQA
jgi:hypothetical protein